MLAYHIRRPSNFLVFGGGWPADFLAGFRLNLFSGARSKIRRLTGLARLDDN